MIEIILMGIILFGLWWFYTNLYREYCIERTRQDLFKLRDQLFDSVENGHIDFNDDAYGILRKTINGMIRYCHELHFVHMLALLLAQTKLSKDNGKVTKEYSLARERANNRLDPEGREVVEATYKTMQIIVISHIITFSFFLNILFRLLRAILTLSHSIERPKAWLFKNIYNTKEMQLIEIKARNYTL